MRVTMSKGYPSVERARKAYWRGATDARRRDRASNPYANAKLAGLWTRGRDRALAEPSLVVPPPFGQRHAQKERPRTDGGGPGRDPRDFDRGGGRGGW
jgi:hypothetical protein